MALATAVVAEQEVVEVLLAVVAVEDEVLQEADVVVVQAQGYARHLHHDTRTLLLTYPRVA